MFLVLGLHLSACRWSGDPWLREEVRVEVDGQQERWQLVWRSAPELKCFRDALVSCPCQGFAVAERGELDLVRIRANGRQETLSLGPLFKDYGQERPGAVLQRWLPAENDGEIAPWEEEAILSQRPSVQAMRLADYDHDGQASEFVLQTAAFGCGLREAVLVGVQQNGRLGAYSSRQYPHEPLVLEPETWEGLVASPKIERVQLGCGDHGSEVEIIARVHATPAGLSDTTDVRNCTTR